MENSPVSQVQKWHAHTHQSETSNPSNPKKDSKPNFNARQERPTLLNDKAVNSTGIRDSRLRFVYFMIRSAASINASSCSKWIVENFDIGNASDATRLNAPCQVFKRLTAENSAVDNKQTFEGLAKKVSQMRKDQGFEYLKTIDPDLENAVKRGECEKIKVLLSHIEDATYKRHVVKAFLRYAVWNGWEGAALALMEGSQPSNDGDSDVPLLEYAMRIATYQGHDHIVSSILDKGILTATQIEEYRDWAFVNGKTKVCWEIINRTPLKDKETLLALVASLCRIDSKNVPLSGKNRSPLVEKNIEHIVRMIRKEYKMGIYVAKVYCAIINNCSSSENCEAMLQGVRSAMPQISEEAKWTIAENVYSELNDEVCFDKNSVFNHLIEMDKSDFSKTLDDQCYTRMDTQIFDDIGEFEEISNIEELTTHYIFQQLEKMESATTLHEFESEYIHLRGDIITQLMVEKKRAELLAESSSV